MAKDFSFNFPLLLGKRSPPGSPGTRFSSRLHSFRSDTEKSEPPLFEVLTMESWNQFVQLIAEGANVLRGGRVSRLIYEYVGRLSVCRNCISSPIVVILVQHNPTYARTRLPYLLTRYSRNSSQHSCIMQPCI